MILHTTINNFCLQTKVTIISFSQKYIQSHSVQIFASVYKFNNNEDKLIYFATDGPFFVWNVRISREMVSGTTIFIQIELN